MKGKKKRAAGRAGRLKEIRDYDEHDTSESIDIKHPVRFEDLGLRLPEQPPTQVVSIRLPTDLLNEIRALGSQSDVSYQALIKLWLADSVKKAKKRAA